MRGIFHSFVNNAVHFVGEQTWEVDPKAEVTLNGKEASIGDLRYGDDVDCNGRPATKVTATRTKETPVAQAARKGFNTAYTDSGQTPPAAPPSPHPPSKVPKKH
jgi:hypothetical protein